MFSCLQFAPVAPAHIIQQLQSFKHTHVGHYHLLLAHDIVETQEKRTTYKQTFVSRDRPLRMYSYNRCIILDNSAVECNGSVDPQMIADAAAVVEPDVIVLPDELLDGAATVEATKASLESIVLTDRFIESGVDYMLVPQGKTWEEWMKCATALSLLIHEYAPKYAKSCWWGVARNLEANGIDRSKASSFLATLEPQWRQHFLGFSDSVLKDMHELRLAKYAYQARVIGIDSAVPLRMASDEIAWSTMSADAYDKPRGDWWDVAERNDLMASNVRAIQSALSSMAPDSRKRG